MTELANMYRGWRPYVRSTASRSSYCIVNESGGYAYVNMPKAGCTSIKTAISQHMGVRYEEMQWNPPWRLGLDQIEKRTDMVRFTFVRHPADRLVSAWADWCCKPYPEPGNYRKNPRYQPLKGCDFQTFLRTVVQWGDYDGHTTSQVELMTISGERVADRVYRFEEMDAGWKVLQHELGLPDLPHERQSEHKPWREYFTGELVRLVEDRYRIDFEAFGYEW